MTPDEAVAGMIRSVAPIWIAAAPDSTPSICGGTSPDGWRYDATSARIEVTGPGVQYTWTRRRVLAAVTDAVESDPTIARIIARWHAARAEHASLMVYVPAKARTISRDEDATRELAAAMRNMRTRAEHAYSELAAVTLLDTAEITADVNGVQLDLFGAVA